MEKSQRSGIQVSLDQSIRKGEAKHVNNYIGITLMNTRYNMYSEIVRNRLEIELVESEVLDRSQMGYRER